MLVTLYTCHRALYLSIKTGSFPFLWKTSNIVYYIPIPKPGDTRNPCNYRPVSLLSVLSKVLERHIYMLISDYLRDNNIISDCQWGFMPKDRLLQLFSQLFMNGIKNLEDGFGICAIFFDLQKAFDSVPHWNLLYVVKDCGLHPILVKWICSSLIHRSQRVVVDGTRSFDVHVVSGVLQGSVLGPPLFLLYINKLKNMDKWHPCNALTIKF